MQRSIPIHPASFVVGLALAAIVFLSMAQSAPAVQSTIRVQYGPDPKDMVQIEQGSPYTVPAGKLFVLTGLGISALAVNNSAVLQVNGVPMVATSQLGSTTPSVMGVPTGFTVQAGASIEPLGGGATSNGRAWGYLANQ